MEKLTFFTRQLMYGWSALLVLWGSASGQTRLRLADCYERAEAQHPLAGQTKLLAAQSGLQQAVTQLNFMPKLALNAQASYQTDVTKVSITIPSLPLSFPSPSKDQYRATLDVSQLIYDGGMTKGQKAAQMAQTSVQQQQVSTQIYGIRERINQLFFNVLLMEENMQVSRLLLEDFETKLSRIQAQLRNGVGQPMAADVLRAQMISVQQRLIEQKATQKAAVQMLGELLDQDLSNVIFEKPSALNEVPLALGVRPENQGFALQKQALDAQQSLVQRKNMPRLSAFVQGGYGEPGLNMFKTGFQPWGMFGLRLNWNFYDFGASKKEREALQIGQKLVEAQEVAFTQSLELQLIQLRNEMEKVKALIAQDKEMLTIRGRIKANVSAQLDQGVATAVDFASEVNAESQARELLSLHELQLLMLQQQYLIVRGK